MTHDDAGDVNVLRVANCSGFFGDRVSAAREMVEGGPIDVLTGDWLAELTMFILHKTRERSGGYAGTFLRQMEDVLPTCLERGITVVLIEHIMRAVMNFSQRLVVLVSGRKIADGRPDEVIRDAEVERAYLGQ